MRRRLAGVLMGIVVVFLARGMVGASAQGSGNLVTNGGADGAASGDDQSSVPPRGWEVTGPFTAVKAGSPNLLDSGSNGNYFAGGPSHDISSGLQLIELYDYTTMIDEGGAVATLSGRLGGWSDQDDAMTVTATFLDLGGNDLGHVTIGPVTASDRGNTTGLLQRSATMKIPVNADAAEIVIEANWANGVYDDAYADDITFSVAEGPPVSVSLPQPSPAQDASPPSSAAAPPSTPAASSSDEGTDPASLLLATGFILALLGIGAHLTPYGRIEPDAEPPPDMPEMPPLPPDAAIPPLPRMPEAPDTESNVHFLDRIVREEVVDHVLHPPPRPPATAPPATPLAPTIDLGPLQEHFASTVQQKIEGGYWVRNPTLMRKIMNNFGKLPYFWDSRSGQCGEFAEWGEQWVKDYVAAHHPGAIVDHVVYGPSYSWAPNHAATRITLPDGQRVIADFWDYMGESKGAAPKLVSEADWQEHWSQHVIGHLQRSEDEMNLKNLIDRNGEERGIVMQRGAMHNVHMGDKADALIRSWQRSPW